MMQGSTKINTFNWANIRKLSFKRKHFLIKLHPHIDALCKDTLVFTLESRDACKAFWKTCVEYHAFFRLCEEPKCKPRPFLCSKGSNFRYSGRTQMQLFDSWTKGKAKNQPFERKLFQANLHERQCRSSPDLLTEVAKQPNDLRLVYISRPCSRSVNSVGWDPLLDENRNSAVLNRSRPQADPPLLQPATSSASFPSCSYSDIIHETPQKQSERRVRSYYEESGHWPGNFMARSHDSTKEPPHAVKSYPGIVPDPSVQKHQMNRASPTRYCYTDGPSLLPKQAAAVAEEIARLTNYPTLFGENHCRSPQTRRTQEYHQPVYPRTNCRNSINMEIKRDVEMMNMEYAQELYPKRSLSHSDMKATYLPYGSEFKPLGPCPILSRTSSVSRTPIAQHLSLPPPPPPSPLPISKTTPRATERYVYSGTESSDSESEIINPYYYALFGKNLRHPMARARLSSGSLQLDEEDDSVPSNVRGWESRKSKMEEKWFNA